MTLARMAPRRRRAPPPGDRYRAVARAVRQRRARPRLPAFAQGVAWAVLLVLALFVADRASVTVSGAAGGLATWTGSLFPAPAAPAELVVSETTGQIGAAPILGSVVAFTKDPALLIQGLVPSFGIAADRKIEVSVNGAIGVIVPIDANGRFAVPVTLRDGQNSIVVALISPIETIATSARTVTLDRTPPPLTLTNPKSGDTVDGPNVTVEGKSEPGAIVIVNDRSVIVAADGSFSDTFTAQSGPLAFTVVARDRAGNETKSTLALTVKDGAKAGTAALTVTLSKSTVKPGEFLTATAFVTNNSLPVANATVSLQVGVVAITSARTDATGHAQITFAAPPNEGLAQVVFLGPNVTGSATLIVAK